MNMNVSQIIGKRNGMLRIGVSQVESVPADLDQNFARHRAAIDEAKGHGVELLVFPELSLTGYHVGSQVLDVALPRDDSRLKQLAAYADDLTVVAGFIEEAPAAQFHNAAIVFRRGEIAFIHRKLNLPSYGNLEEDKYFAEGRYIDVFEHQLPWIAAILICADMWNPGLVHLAALNGATMLIGPIASSTESVGGGFSNESGWASTSSFYAMIYGVPVILANQCGDQGGHRFWGGSRIVDPHGMTLAEADEGETLIVADLDFNEVRRARFRLPTVRDSNLDLIHREIERLANRLGIPRVVRSNN